MPREKIFVLGSEDEGPLNELFIQQLSTQFLESRANSNRGSLSLALA